jgi:hypothetical protein
LSVVPSSGAINFGFGFFIKLFDALADTCLSLSFVIHHGVSVDFLFFLYLNDISDKED